MYEGKEAGGCDDASPRPSRDSEPTTDQLRTKATKLSTPQRSTMDTNEMSFTLSDRCCPIWGVKGSRVQISPARQVHFLVSGTFAAQIHAHISRSQLVVCALCVQSVCVQFRFMLDHRVPVAA